MHFFRQNKSLNATLDTENQRRTQLESDLKVNAQEIAALRATEKQLAKVGILTGLNYISFAKIFINQQEMFSKDTAILQMNFF